MRLTKEQEAVNVRIGCNLYGRLDHIRHLAEQGEDAYVRNELLELLRFFPRNKPQPKKPKPKGNIMGDRCYMQITCRRRDVPTFETIGFTVYEDHPSVLFVIMNDEEANYAHNDALPKDIPFYGWHGSGGDYSAGRVACDGNEGGDIEATHDGELFVRVDENGEPLAQYLKAVKRFIAIENNAKHLVGLHEQTEP